MIVVYRLNYYVAVERGTANYSGYAESEQEFIKLCEEAGFNLDGCEIEEVDRNVRPFFGRMPKKCVKKDLGTI